MATEGEVDPTRRRVATVATAAVGAVVGCTAPAHPTTVRVADLVLLGALGSVVAVAGSRTRSWTLVLATGVAAGTASGALALVAWAALLTALAIAIRRPDDQEPGWTGTTVALAALVCLARIGSGSFQGSTMLLGAAALAPVVASAARWHRPAANDRLRRTGIAAASAVIVATALAGGAALLARSHLDRGAAASEEALRDARAGRAEAAAGNLEAAEVEFTSARSLLTSWWTQPARLVPIVSQQIEAAATAAEVGQDVARTGADLGAIGDYRSLKYRSGRIDLPRVAALSPPVRRAARVLHRSTDRLRSLDRAWLLPSVARPLSRLDRKLAAAADQADTAGLLLDVVPGLLGGSGDRHYFVAFVNPAEARGLGGFLGNYGELTASNGKLRLTRSGAISEIEPRPGESRTLTGPDEYLARYGRFDPADYFRDATFSPHLPYVAEVISQLYPQAGGMPVDGVVSMDPYALAALLRFTGPIRVAGYDRLLTSSNLADITLRQQYLDFGDRNQARKDLLVDATKVAFDRLLEGDLPSPGRMVDVLGPMVRQRRLLLWSPDPAEERAFTRIGADGRLPKTQGQDAFLLAHQNYGNSKIDAYLQRSIRYRATVDERTGRVTATVDITLRNGAPGTGLPRYAIGNNRGAPWGTNLMNLTAYSALVVRAAELDGAPVSLLTQREAGLNAYDLPITIPPGGTAHLRLHLAGGVDLRRGPYRLSLTPLPQVNPDRISVTVDGRAPHRCTARGRTPRPVPRQLAERTDVGAAGCRPA